MSGQLVKAFSGDKAEETKLGKTWSKSEEVGGGDEGEDGVGGGGETVGGVVGEDGVVVGGETVSEGEDGVGGLGETVGEVETVDEVLSGVWVRIKPTRIEPPIKLPAIALAMIIPLLLP